MHPQLVALAALPVPNRLAPGQVKQGFQSIINCLFVQLLKQDPPFAVPLH